MVFEVSGKVALITGGVSGIGYECAKALLRNGLKAATLIDVNDDLGRSVIKEFSDEFGYNRVLFLQVDVRNKERFEEAFKFTITNFGNVDIVINNAGVLDDNAWEDEIDINIKGTVNGTLLALDNYLPKYKSGYDGLVVNISSVTALEEEPSIPVYVATKAAILAFSRSFGAIKHYERTRVRVITLCIGGTITNIAHELHLRLLSPNYLDMFIEHSLKYPVQTVESVGIGLLKVVKEGKPGSVWVIEGDEKAYEIEFSHRIGKPKL